MACPSSSTLVPVSAAVFVSRVEHGFLFMDVATPYRALMGKTTLCALPVALYTPSYAVSLVLVSADIVVGANLFSSC